MVEPLAVHSIQATVVRPGMDSGPRNSPASGALNLLPLVHCDQSLLSGSMQHHYLEGLSTHALHSCGPHGV